MKIFQKLFLPILVLILHSSSHFFNEAITQQLLNSSLRTFDQRCAPPNTIIGLSFVPSAFAERHTDILTFHVL